MSEIFVSYAREDRARVEALVHSLEEQGFSVWWDRDIAPGDSFDELIDTEIAQAEVVLVVWTKQSIESRWVRNEALEGMDRGILVPVLLDEVRIPVAFRQTQLARLVHWPIQVHEPDFHDLVNAIRSKIERNDNETRYVKPRRRLLPTGKARLSIAIAFAFVLALGTAITMFLQRSTLPQDDRQSVAVMRFETSTNDRDRLLADGISHELLRLLRIGGVPVIQREATWDLPRTLAAQGILDRVGARFLVDGTLEQRGTGFLTTASIFDANENDEIWRTEIRLSAPDMFASNRQLAREILSALGARTDLLDQARANAQADPDAYELFLQGQDLLRQLGGTENLDAAKTLLGQSIDIDPAFAEAHAALCRTHLALYRSARDTDDFESAEKFCHRALTFEDRDGAIHLALGDLYEQSGQLSRATEQYERALLLDSELADAYIGLGEVLASSGDKQRAQQAFGEAVKRQPGYWQGFLALGSFYLRHGRLIEAIEAYTRVTYLVPNNPWAFNNRGAARFFSGNFEGAIDDWERATRLEPGPAALSNIGTAYFHLRRFDDAAEKYRQALNMNPRDHRLWGNLGDTYRLIPEKKDAANDAYRRQIALANDNLKVNSSDATTLSRSAVSLAFMGQADQARSSLERAIELAPQHLDVLYDAAVAYATLGEPASAVNVLQRAVDAGYAANHVASDPLFDGLRATPGYAEIVGEI